MTQLDPQLQPPVLVLTRTQPSTERRALQFVQRSPRSSRKLLASAAVAAVVSLVMLVAVFGVCWARRQRPLARGTASRSLSYTEDDSDEVFSIIEQCLELEEEYGLQQPVAEHLEQRGATESFVATLHTSASASQQWRTPVSPQNLQDQHSLALSGVPQAMYIPAQQPSHTAVWGGPSGATGAQATGTMTGDAASFSPVVEQGGDVAYTSQQRQAPVSSQSLQDQHRSALSGCPEGMYIPTRRSSHTVVWGGPSGATGAQATGTMAGDAASFSPVVVQGGDVVHTSQQRQAPVSSQSLQDQLRLALSGDPQAMYMPPQQPFHTVVWGGPSGATGAPVARRMEGDAASFSPEVEQGGDVAYTSQQRQAPVSSQSLQDQQRSALSGDPEGMYIPTRRPSHTVVWGAPRGATVAGRIAGNVGSFAPEVVQGDDVVYTSQQRQAPVASQSLQYQQRLGRPRVPQNMYMPAPMSSHMVVYGSNSRGAVGPAERHMAGDVASSSSEAEQGGAVGFASHSHSSASYGGAEAGAAALPATVDDVDGAADDDSDASARPVVGSPLWSPDNASAAAFSPDAWLEDMLAEESPPVVQKRTEAAPDSSRAAADDKRAAPVSHGPPAPPETMDGKQKLEAGSVASSGSLAPATSMQRTSPSGDDRELSMDSVDLSAHPFVRLPTVDPRVVPRCFRPEYALTVKLNIFSPMNSFVKMRSLFAKKSLTAKEAELLLFEAENLASYAREKLAHPTNRLKPSYVFRKLSSLFMVVDYLVCTMEVLGDKMVTPLWWNEFVCKFQTDFRLPDDSYMERTRMVTETVHRLSAAFSIYKQGKRPPFKEIIELKRLILTEQIKGSQLRNPLWRQWLEDDEEFFRSRGISRERPRHARWTDDV